MLKYLQTDTCLFRAPFSDDHSLDGSPSKKLNDMQDEFYGPVQEWFENRFEVKVEPAKGFRLPTVTDDTFEEGCRTKQPKLSGMNYYLLPL